MITLTHKFIIEAEISPSPIVQGQSFFITLKISNIGDKKFPGGKISKYEINYYGFGNARTTITDESKLILPEIPVSSTFEINNTFNAISEGLVWIHIDTISNDEEIIEMYHSKDMMRAQRPWQLPITVISGENAQIIKLLQEIVEKLDKILEFKRGGG